MVKVPLVFLSRSIEGRCHCRSEAGRLLCYAGDLCREYDDPALKDIPVEDKEYIFEAWLAQLALDLSWAPPTIAFRAQVEDWSRSLILKTLRLSRATEL